MVNLIEKFHLASVPCWPHGLRVLGQGQWGSGHLSLESQDRSTIVLHLRLWTLELVGSLCEVRLNQKVLGSHLKIGLIILFCSLHSVVLGPALHVV